MAWSRRRKWGIGTALGVAGAALGGRWLAPRLLAARGFGRASRAVGRRAALRRVARQRLQAKGLSPGEPTAFGDLWGRRKVAAVKSWGRNFRRGMRRRGFRPGPSQRPRPGMTRNDRQRRDMFRSWL